jgi:MerR family mercuric resistance operon transcriptional regulator
MAEHSAQLLAIGELSRRSGVPVDTIRYYERAGIIGRPRRTAGGHRAYDCDAVKALSLAKSCRSLGFPLADVRAILGLVSKGYRCGDVRAIAEGHLEEIRRKRAELQEIEGKLAAVIGRCGAADDPVCAIVDSLLDGEAIASG